MAISLLTQHRSKSHTEDCGSFSHILVDRAGGVSRCFTCLIPWSYGNLLVMKDIGTLHTHEKNASYYSDRKEWYLCML